MLTGEKKREYQRKWWAKNKVAHNEYMKKWLDKPGNRKKNKDNRDAWAKRNPDKITSKRVEKYGLTLAEYKKMVLAQNGCCKICNNNFIEQLCVDHDHTTGKVRGLLCKKCNIGLGAFKDTITNLGNAIKYLRNSRDD